MENNTEKLIAAGDAVEAAREELRSVVALIGGKWKLEILWLLHLRVHRFNELRRAIPDVTQHMLTVQLRELEADGLVRRTVYAEVPPRVEYEITDASRRLRPVFRAIMAWAEERRANSPAVAEKRGG
jgi:DNA-binding HxlR family transcriptional regulator